MIWSVATGDYGRKRSGSGLRLLLALALVACGCVSSKPLSLPPPDRLTP
jgi:hypothetical protein